MLLIRIRVETENFVNVEILTIMHKPTMTTAIKQQIYIAFGIVEGYIDCADEDQYGQAWQYLVDNVLDLTRLVRLNLADKRRSSHGTITKTI